MAMGPSTNQGAAGTDAGVKGVLDTGNHRAATPSSNPRQNQQQQQPTWSVSDSIPATKKRLDSGGRRKVDMGYKKELRRPDEVVGTEGVKVYRKSDEGENYYYSGKKVSGGGRGGSGSGSGSGSHGSLTRQQGGATAAPVAVERSDSILKDNGNTNTPASGQQTPQKKQRLPGTLTSDLLGPPASSSRPGSPSTRGNTTGKKVHLSVTNSNLRVQNTGLSDLESALRALELNTAPTLHNVQKRPTCDCMATTHDLLLAAPNCLSCGKIVCIKEGLGPCTFCGTPLLSSSETEDMISFLRAERGREKMQADNSANRRAKATQEKPKLYSQGHTGAGYGTPAASGRDNDDDDNDDAAALQRAREHRDKLLSFQATNAQRTKIIDEAADFDTSAISSAGFALNMWATPEERALQLKKQQKRMREIEWAGKEDWEKRKMVFSIDIKSSSPTPGGEIGTGKGKAKARAGGGQRGSGSSVVAVARREMTELQMNEAHGSSEKEEEEAELLSNHQGQGQSQDSGRRMYTRNPLLKGLIRPVFTPVDSSTSKARSGASTNKHHDNEYGDGDEAVDDGYFDSLPEVVKLRMREAARLGKSAARVPVKGVCSGEGGWRRVLQDEQEIKDNEAWVL